MNGRSSQRRRPSMRAVARLGREPSIARRHGIVAGRREGHRQRERDGRPAIVRGTVAHHGDRPAEEAPRGGEVAGRDRVPDVRAADRCAVEAERPDHLDLEVTLRAKLGDRAGVPPRSWPKAASGVMRKPAIEARAAIESMNASKGVWRSRSSKCWTTVTSTPAAARRRSRSSASHRSGGAARRGSHRGDGRT